MANYVMGSMVQSWSQSAGKRSNVRLTWSMAKVCVSCPHISTQWSALLTQWPRTFDPMGQEVKCAGSWESASRGYGDHGQSWFSMVFPLSSWLAKHAHTVKGEKMLRCLCSLIDCPCGESVDQMETNLFTPSVQLILMRFLYFRHFTTNLSCREDCGDCAGGTHLKNFRLQPLCW